MKRMKNKNNKPYIEIPEKLQPDAFQPYSIIPKGDWVDIGSSSLAAHDVKDKALSKVAASFGNAPNQEGEGNMQEASNKLQELEALLAMVNNKGYTLNRKQRFEVIDQVSIPSGHSDKITTAVYLGVQHDQSHHERGIDVLGLNLGVYKLSENSMTINAMPMFKDKDLSQIPYQSAFANFEDKDEETIEKSEPEEASLGLLVLAMNDRVITHKSHEQNAKRLQEDAFLVMTDGELEEGMHGQQMSFAINGGDTGARYVLYQLVDHISITRNQEIENVSPVVYEGHFRHAVLTARYPFEG